jgi:hypothetical protein
VDKTIHFTNPYITLFHNGGDELMVSARCHPNLKFLNGIAEKCPKVKMLWDLDDSFFLFFFRSKSSWITRPYLFTQEMFAYDILGRNPSSFFKEYCCIDTKRFI